MPGTAKLQLVVALSNGKKVTQPLAEMTLKSGGQYTINARIVADDMIVSASGEIENWTDEGEIEFEGEGTTEELPVEFTEHDGYFMYDGVKYKTVVLADGNTWMAENLRFIPRGRTVSSDPAEDAASGILQQMSTRWLILHSPRPSDYSMMQLQHSALRRSLQRMLVPSKAARVSALQAGIFLQSPR